MESFKHFGFNFFIATIISFVYGLFFTCLFPAIIDAVKVKRKMKLQLLLWVVFLSIYVFFMLAKIFNSEGHSFYLFHLSKINDIESFFIFSTAILLMSYFLSYSSVYPVIKISEFLKSKNKFKLWVFISLLIWIIYLAFIGLV